MSEPVAEPPALWMQQIQGYFFDLKTQFATGLERLEETQVRFAIDLGRLATDLERLEAKVTTGLGRLEEKQVRLDDKVLRVEGKLAAVLATLEAWQLANEEWQSAKDSQLHSIGMDVAKLTQRIANIEGRALENTTVINKLGHLQTSDPDSLSPWGRSMLAGGPILVHHWPDAPSTDAHIHINLVENKLTNLEHSLNNVSIRLNRITSCHCDPSLGDIVGDLKEHQCMCRRESATGDSHPISTPTSSESTLDSGLDYESEEGRVSEDELPDVPGAPRLSLGSAFHS